jgi:hypothetical protein
MGRSVHSLKPQRLLEIGCYEGRATVAMIEMAARYCDPQITCVDTWAGAVDLPPHMMRGVEDRFDKQYRARAWRLLAQVTFSKRKQPSVVALADLIAHGKRFDLIYIDGSHTVACDVLTDAVMAFHLLGPAASCVR